MRKLTIFLMFILFSVSQVWAQNRTVTGKVTDEKGAGVADAAVTATATRGVLTGKDGSFSITIPTNAKTLTIRSVGFATQTVNIPSAGSVSVKMRASDDSQLDEVVVQVPYGTQKQTAFTGSQGTVGSKQLEKQQNSSFTKSLEGQIAGISATNGGGAPGSNADIRIRGIGSLSGDASPLYVLNGVIYDGSIASISPDDIETVTILKDAASAALYGARGSNGVIMITTKKGKKGKAQINIRATQGYVTRGIPSYDRLSQKEYYEMMWEATRNANVFGGASTAAASASASNDLTSSLVLGYNAYNIPGNQLVNPTTGKLNSNAKLLWNESWEKALFRTAKRQNVTASVAGASDRSDYLLSLGYLNEEGTMINTGYKRYNVRLNLNTTANDWLKAGLNIDGAFSRNDNVINGGTATSNPFYTTQQIAPIYPVYQHNLTTGEIVIDPATGKPMFDFGIPSQMGTRPYAPNSNIVATIALDERSRKDVNANANTYLEAKLSKHFSLKTTFGINLFNRYSTTYQNNEYGDALNVKGRSTKGAYSQISYTLNEVLTWNQSFGKHNFFAIAGHENYFLQIDQSSAQATGFAFAGQTQLTSASTVQETESQQDNHRIEGVFSSLNYDFDKKYLVSASIRRDGNSRFASAVRWGNFSSVGIGWRMSEESFMKKVNWVNELKFKANYGSLGNEGINTYYAYQNVYLGGYPNVNAPGYIPDTKAPNPELRWETPSGINIGFDFSLFSRRLQGSVEYFSRGSKGLFFDVPLPVSTGVTYITKNVAEMTNKGFELQLGYNAIQKKNFDWRIDLNVTSYKNEITSIPSPVIEGTKRLAQGYSIFDFYMREYAGVDAATGDALFYKDIVDATGKSTGERTITNDYSKSTQYYVGGSSLPKFFGGLTNTFRYKNYELSVLLTYAYGGKFYDGNYAGLNHSGTPGTAWHKDILRRWQKPGDVTDVPRVQTANATDGAFTSSRYLFDGSYINIKNITLTYNLPKATATKLHLNGLSVYGNIDNAVLFSAKKGMDPQRSFNGVSDATFPPVRTVTFGLNVNL